MAISLGPIASNPNLVSVTFTPTGRPLQPARRRQLDQPPCAAMPPDSPPAPAEHASYRLLGAARSPATLHANTATYRNVLPHTDLRLSTIASGLDEALILRSPNAPNSWTFPLTLTGLTPRLAKDGGIDLLNSSGAIGRPDPARLHVRLQLPEAIRQPRHLDRRHLPAYHRR